MGLINYTNLEDDTTADANKFNERFGAIIDEVNGNLDTQNLKNSAVTEAKIADGAVTSSKIATERYVDANGWTVNDLGATKTYTYTVPVSGISIVNGARKDNLPTIQPPVGRTRDNIIMTCTWYGGYAGHAVPGVEAGAGTSIAPMLGNQYVASGLGNSLTFTGVIYISAVEAL